METVLVGGTDIFRPSLMDTSVCVFRNEFGCARVYCARLPKMHLLHPLFSLLREVIDWGEHHLERQSAWAT